MNPYVLSCYLAVLLAGWGAYCVWVVQLPGSGLSRDLLNVLLFPVLVGGLNWIGYGIFLVHRVVPKVDALVDPDLYAHPAATRDDWLARWFRLIRYGCASSSKAYNRRCFNRCDFRKLPASLRVPMAVFCYWMLLGVLSVGMGYLLTLFVDTPIP